MYKLLIIEDDEGIAQGIAACAQSWGMQPQCVRDFRNVMAEFAEFEPHLVLLDISLPFMSGYYWCQEIRTVSSVPVIFISSAADNMNIIMAMNMGADDFIAKPFDQSVLIAKIQAILRRAYDFGASAPVLEHMGAVKKLAGDFINKRIKLEYTELNAAVLTDEKWLAFVIEQVLSNALKYTPEGTVSVYLERPKTLCIRDTGIGIATEDLPRVFENGYTVLLFAIVHLGFAFPMINKLLLLFGLENLGLLLLTAAISALVFALFYIIVYRVTSNAYYSIVSGTKE